MYNVFAHENMWVLACCYVVTSLISLGKIHELGFRIRITQRTILLHVGGLPMRL